ncbi:MAG: glycosyl hydrolase family 18 protein [Bacteroidales bacterium]
MILRKNRQRLIEKLIGVVIFWGILLSCNGPKVEHRLIHNNDGSDALGNHWFHNRLLTVDDVNAYVDMVSNSQVTTFMMCPGSDFFYYRSEFGRSFGDDLNGQLDCGTDTATTIRFRNFYRNLLNLEKEGTDVIAASLKRAKENGMETFITYRMNDLHFNDTATHCPIVYTDFWFSHPEYWTNDSTPGWNASRALDFAHKEVRDRKLGIISEQLDKYDMIDGLDLDFMRFIVYFKKNETQKNAPLMTQLVKDVRAKVDELSATRGKKILLSVRVPPTVEDCLKKGLDIKEWIRLGLVDFVSIGVHWRGDPSLPVDKFIKDMAPADIPVYASIDDGGYNQREPYSHGMLRGMASHILAQKADGIYLFNQYYGDFNTKYNGQLHLEEGGQVCRVIMPQLLQDLGSLKTLENRNKIYCLSDGTEEYEIRQVSPLPLTVANNSPSEAKIFIGDDPQKTLPEEVILFFRLSNASDFEVTINGIKLETPKPEYVSLYDRARGMFENDQEYAFQVPVKSIKDGYNSVVFKGINNKFTVKRLEIALKHGDVETHGYF